MKERLSPVMSITEDDALRDMRGPPAPPGISQRVWAKGRNAGGCGVSWHRGRQAGLHDAILTVAQKYPRVAKQLADAYGIDKKGNITL